MSDKLPELTHGLAQHFDNQELSTAAELVCLSIGLPAPSLEGADADARLLALRDMLTRWLTDLIDHDLARLPQLLYRVDVDERLVDEVFRSTPLDEVPAALANLIVERALLALHRRRAYDGRFSVPEDERDA